MSELELMGVVQATHGGNLTENQFLGIRINNYSP